MNSRSIKIAAARAALAAYRGETRRVVVDISGLTHKEVAFALYGGAWGQLRALARFLAAGLLWLCPFQGLKIAVYRCLGVRIGSNVYISPTVFIDCTRPALLSIGDNVMIGMGANIAMHERNMDILALGRVQIGNGVTIGGKSLIRHGVRIFDGVVVEAMSNVKRDMRPTACIAGGP